MNINWEISGSDIKKVVDFVNQHKDPFVENRINRNINRQNINIDKDIILKTMLMCLVTYSQDTGSESNTDIFFRKQPNLLTYPFLFKATDMDYAISKILKINGLEKNIKKITKCFIHNFYLLEETDWKLETELNNFLIDKSTKHTERVLADRIDDFFKGFGSKQARNFLQSLGLTKYEIPIDDILINWMKDFGYPILFSTVALQDKAFYHFVSDGIQLLCEKSNIFPCVLDAAIFSDKAGVEK